MEANLARLGTNTFQDAKTPEEKKAKVREEIVKRAAYNRAAKAAIEFARPLIEGTQVKADALEAAAKTNNLTVKVTEPFDRENPPKALDVDQNFTKAAFALTAEDPFAQPVGGKDGVYIIAYNNKIPSEIPSLEYPRARHGGLQVHESGATCTHGWTGI